MQGDIVKVGAKMYQRENRVNLRGQRSAQGGEIHSP